MTSPLVSSPAYQACAAQSFRAEFGVCRGEEIVRFEDLNLGDIYLVKPDAQWVSVQARNAQTDVFELDVAANLPTQNLTTLARLIFMTTTGRRADVFATVSQGQTYLVADVPLRPGAEYVLIDITTLDVELAPVVVDTPARLVPQPQQLQARPQLRVVG